MEEVFKPIKGYPGYYVSNLGRVKSEKRDETKIMAKYTTSAGYAAAALFQGKKMRIIQLNRIVLETFRGYPADPWLCVAHHLDGDRTNCRLDNLEWVVCETTADYDPQKSHRRGVLKPDFTKDRMTEAKYHQSRESIERGLINRRKTMEFLKFWKKK